MFKTPFCWGHLQQKKVCIFMHHFQAHQTVHIEVFVDFFNPQGKTTQNHQRAVF